MNKYELQCSLEGQKVDRAMAAQYTSSHRYCSRLVGSGSAGAGWNGGIIQAGRGKAMGVGGTAPAHVQVLW